MVEDFSLPIRYLGLPDADPDRADGRDGTSDQRGKVPPFECPTVDPAQLVIEDIEDEDRHSDSDHPIPHPAHHRVGDLPVFNVRQNRAPT